MNASGLPDHRAPASQELPACPRCQAVCRTPGGLCVGCLLQVGLEAAETGAEESLEALFSVADASASGQILGNYEVLEEIGRGGMGVIFRARQRHTGRTVALKRVLGYHADSPATVARFRREAETAARLDHPNILPIYEVGEDLEGLPYFSMKYAARGHLLQAATDRMAPREAVRLMLKVTRAAHHAHRAGVLHRDLKPGNILLDENDEPFVSDFGLARWLVDASDLTRTLTIFGTPGYIAPEQAHGPSACLTPAADVYSLGAVLFELLAGRPPFLGEHALGIIRQAAEQDAPRLRSLVPALDRDLETVCARCLEREPAARYQSAGELADDLEHWLDGRPLVARPVSPLARLWRGMRRRPLETVAALVCLGLLVSLGFHQLEASRMRRTLEEATRLRHSLVVCPFLDLDTSAPDTALGFAMRRALEADFARHGPAVVCSLPQVPTNWTGASTQEEIRTIARRSNTRVVLSGTVRRIDGRRRVSLRLMREDGTSVLSSWITELGASDDLGRVLSAPGEQRSLYSLLDASVDQAVDPADRDPAMQNPTARAYLNTGRSLMENHNTEDLDRAIDCLEGAVRSEPRTVSARSYLSMAYLGRYFLGGDGSLVERASKLALEASQLSPEDPLANRALCLLYTSTGRSREALERGLRALEYGDFSERALGQVAYAWKALGHPEKAILWFKKAQASGRQPADYNALLGDCWAELGEDTKAAEEYNAAVRFRPDRADGWIGLCILALWQRDFDGAQRMLLTHQATYREAPATRHLEAQIKFFARDYPAAIRLYRELARVSPGGGVYMYGEVDAASAIGVLRMRLDDLTGKAELEASRRAALSALESNPQAPDTLYRLAAIEAALEEKDSALRHLQAASDAGWIDHRSPGIDPRFDSLQSDPRFRQILEAMAAHVASLRQPKLAE